MGLKRAGEIIAHQTGLFAASKYLSLHTANPTDANELTGNGYARLELASSGVTITASTGQAANNAVLNFFTPTGDFGSAVTHMGLYSALTAGNLLFSTALTSGNVVLQQNANISAAVSAITVLISGGDLLAVGSNRCMTGGLFGSRVDVGLHTAAPTNANEVSGNGYARVQVAAADWTVASGTGRVSNTNDLTFPTPTGTWGDATHIALYNSSGSRFYTDALDNNPPSILAGATVTIGAGQLYVDLQTDN